MQFNSDANSQDLVSEILTMSRATLVTYSINDITRRFNFALDDYFDLAFEADGPWPFDDINQSSAAIATQALTSGVNAYKISAFSGSATNILGVAILDSNGKVQTITPEDFSNINRRPYQNEFPAFPIEFEIDYDVTATGQPTYYTKFGNYIYLRPTPNYTNAAGLRAYVERNPLYMLPTDTNKEPGIPKKHQLYLCRKTALPYLLENSISNANAIAAQIMKDEMDIKKYFAQRDKSIDHHMVSSAARTENSSR